MTRGEVRLDYTFWGWLFKKPEARTVHRCERCGSWTCPICRKAIPEYLETCPYCGDVVGREA